LVSNATCTAYGPVEPEHSEQFATRAPPEISDAMRQTVSNLIGNLPPQFFSVTISGVAENLAQLMYSMLMTGYMFRNAQYRMVRRGRGERGCVHTHTRTHELESQAPQERVDCVKVKVCKGKNVKRWAPPLRTEDENGGVRIAPPYAQELQNSVALPPSSSVDSGGGGVVGAAGAAGIVPLLSLRGADGKYETSGAGADYSPGSQKIGVTGEVIRYSESAGVERRDAAEYMGELEDEVKALRAELERLRGSAGAASQGDPDKNELLVGLQIESSCPIP
jgi:hypothetical protein